MATRNPTHPPPKFSIAASLPQATIFIVAATAAIALGWAAALGSSTFRISIVAALVIAIGSLVLHSPTVAVYATFSFLAPLGLVRRLVSAEYGEVGNDPLLLIGPLILTAIGLLAILAPNEANEESAKTLAITVGVLQLLLLLATFNPQIDAPTDLRVSALIYFVVPTMAFWAGRRILTEKGLSRILTAIPIVASLAVGYGLWQLYVGFPSWDQAWLDIKRSGDTYLALNVRGVIRPFSIFPSAEEYSLFLGCALAVVIAAWFSKSSRTLWAAPTSALLMVGIVTIGNRAGFLMTLLAFAAALGAKRKLSPVLAMSVGTFMLVGLFVVAPLINPNVLGERASQLIEHQIGGISDPLNSDQSTLAIHTSLQTTGVKRAFTEPLGSGTAPTRFIDRDTNIESRATERDIGDIATAAGLPGLVAYLLVATSAMFGAYRLAVSRGGFVPFAALGILVVTFQQWFDGGLYFVAPLAWLTIGVLSQHFIGRRST